MAPANLDNRPEAGLSPRAALCIGHPGHELRVFQWMRIRRPLTSVLTDGSGPDRAPRIESTRRILREAGAREGSIFGTFPDREIYAMMLAGDPAPFIDLAGRLVDEWEAAGIEMVAGDMIEGFNTSHDICRLMINAAVARLRRATGREIANLEFPLEKLGPLPPPEGSVVVDLDDEMMEAKRRTACELYPEIEAEVERAIAKFGVEPFRREVLVPASLDAGLAWEDDEPPFYERYGARQVAAGHYDRLITFREHIQPLARALHAWGHSEP